MAGKRAVDKVSKGLNALIDEFAGALPVCKTDASGGTEPNNVEGLDGQNNTGLHCRHDGSDCPSVG